MIEKDPQSPLAPLAKLVPEALARIRTRRYSDVDKAVAMPASVSVLARWNNAENPPAIVQKKFGRGRVLLFTTTAGRKWTDWPLDPTYVLSVRSAALAIARSQGQGSTLTAGDAMHVSLDAGQVAIDPKITLPNMGATGTPGAASPPVAAGLGPRICTNRYR